MKTSEKIYTALVLALLIFCFMAIANFQFVLIPRMENARSIAVFQFVTALFVIHATTFAVTAGINLKAKALRTVPTTIQIVALFLFVYGIPLAIWGIVLLAKRNKSANNTQEGIAEELGKPSE